MLDLLYVNLSHYVNIANSIENETYGMFYASSLLNELSSACYILDYKLVF